MIQSFLLVIAISLDSLLAALAYGTKHIQIPIRCAVLISTIGVIFLSISLYTANLLQQFIPHGFCALLSFLIFFLIGLSTLFQGTIKRLLKNYKQRQLAFRYSGISFVLNIYLDETKADIDNSNDLSLKEALYLAIALSIDSLVSGFALGISIVHPFPVLIASFFVGILAILCGALIGAKVTYKRDLDLSWLSGILFLILAFSRIV